MKNIALLISIITICNFSFAQPILTAATTNPVPGDSFNFYRCDASNLTPGMDGASAIWDFTTLVAVDSYYQVFAPCKSAPDCGLYPASNLVSYDAKDIYLYYSAKTKALSSLGRQATSTSTSTVSTDPLDNLRYPLSFTGTFTDSYSDITTTASKTMYRSGETVTNVDGYGTLKLPYGVFNSVLRIHTVIISKDSTVGGDVFTTKGDRYQWYAAGIHEALLSIYFYETPTGTTVNLPARYIAVPATAVTQLNKFSPEIKLYPNPSDGNFKVNVTSSNNEPIAISVTNLFGQVLSTINSITNKDSDVSINASPGIYFVNIITSSGLQTEKIIVRK